MSKGPIVKGTAVLLWAIVVVSLCAGCAVGYAIRLSEMFAPHLVFGVRRLPQLSPQPAPFTFPAGGRILAGSYRFVALYGTPSMPDLGVLGQQPLPDAITRVKNLADEYSARSAVSVMPTFEIIATVASATPTENNDYSTEIPEETLRPWVLAAQAAGVYVVLDLQPGRSDFLTQAKEYESLLQQPNVGLALDPEWRLGPDQLPLVQIGSVDIHEVNGVVAWLADLTATHHLPQKLFVLHEFRTDMIPDRSSLVTSRSELAYVVQMDGQGSQPEKQATWQAVTASPPDHVVFGWKNFYEKDSPMLSPEDTMAIQPVPWYISYQ